MMRAIRLIISCWAFVQQDSNSDWFVNSLIIDIYEIFLVQPEFSVQRTSKKILIDNQYETFYDPVRMDILPLGWYSCIHERAVTVYKYLRLRHMFLCITQS